MELICYTIPVVCGNDVMTIRLMRRTSRTIWLSGNLKQVIISVVTSATLTTHIHIKINEILNE